MKILFITRSLAVGGAERQLAVLAKGLNLRDHNVIVAAFYGGGAIESDLQSGNVCIINLKKRGRWNNFTFLVRLVRLVRQERPDVVHGYLGIPNILTIFLKLVLPSIKVVWGVRASDMDLSRYDWLSRLCYGIECLLSSRANLIIANSSAGKAFAVKSGFPAKKMIVIPNGIDTDHFRPDRKAGLAVRRGWQVPNDAPLVGLVGRIDPMKDHVTFLHAAKYVHVVCPEVRFACVGRGEGASLDNLQRLAAELEIGDAVIWAGERHDLPCIYSSLDLLCLSSCTEAFPNVVCEAMACGTPCVVTDVGDAAQIIGSTGRIVSPKDPKALGEALLSMLVARRELPDYSLRQRISENFGVERLITNTEVALEKLHMVGNKE